MAFFAVLAHLLFIGIPTSGYETKVPSWVLSYQKRRDGVMNRLVVSGSARENVASFVAVTVVVGVVFFIIL